MKTLMNGVEVTVVEMKKGGWVSIQLSNGDIKSVRKNMITYVNDDVPEVETYTQEEEVMNELSFETDEDAEIQSEYERFRKEMEQYREEANQASAIEIEKALAQAEIEANDLIVKEIEFTVNRGIKFIHAVEVLESYTPNSEEWNLILGAILRSARGFKYVKKSFEVYTPVSSQLNYRVTIQQYISDTLSWYENNQEGSGKGLSEKFQKALVYTNTYRFETDEEVSELIAKKYVHPGFADLTYVPKVDSPIQVFVGNSAIMLRAVRGAVIQLSNGRNIVINNNKMVGISIKDSKRGVTALMDKVVIHSQYLITDTKKDKDIKVWSDNSISVVGNSLIKLFLVKVNKINLDVLVNDKLSIKSKIVGLNLEDKLEEISLPGATLPRIYTNTGLVSLSEAKTGIVSTMVDNPAIALFKGKEVLTIDTVNKAIARADKQEKENGWDIGTHRVFLVKDARKTILNELLGTGCIYVPESFLNRFLMGRITSKMISGGIKAATNYYPDDRDYMVVGPAAFKGGEFGLLNLLGFEMPMEVFNNPSNKFVATARKAANAKIETITFAGEKVEGWFLDIPLRMTNAIGIEQYQWAEKAVSNSLMNRTVILSGAEETPNGLRDLIMHKACSDVNFSAVQYISEGLVSGKIVEKKNETRHTASIFQTAVQWHGHKAVMSLIRALINNMTSGQGGKRLGVQYLTGDITPTVKINALDIARYMIASAEESNKPLLEGVNTYPISLLHYMLEEANADLETRRCEWFAINFNGEQVLVPSNGHLYNTEQGMETDRTFLANSFLKDVLDMIKGFITTNYDEQTGKATYLINSKLVYGQGKFLQAKIQASLFGKTFGYLTTVGSYQVVLPTIDQDQLDHEMQVTDPTMFQREEYEYNTQGFLAVNGCKYPAYFEDAFAGYILHHCEFDSVVVEFALRKAVFMTHEAIMIMQNDADGDLHQISNDCYQLPLFKGPRQSFNSESFIKFVEEERQGNVIKNIKGLNRTSLSGFHKAIEGAVKSKDAIGLYTSTKYKYETLFEGITNFLTTDGKIIDVDSKLRNMVISTMAYLCQVEAMDNIKQSGSNEAIMERLAIHKLANIQEELGETIEQAIDKTLKSIISSLNLLFTAEDWDVDSNFANTMAELCYYAANLTVNPMKGFNIYQDRVVNDKRFNAVVEELSGNIVKEDFDLFDSYSDVLSSIDSNSMYSYLTKQLVKAFS